MRRALIFTAAAGALALLAYSRAQAASGGALSLLSFGGGDLNQADAVNATYDANVAAFLAVIRHAEGTDNPNGYRELFGGGHFDSYADHPRIEVTRPAGQGFITSTAAGAYQILARTWDSEVQPALMLPDFSPASQDAAAVFLIDRRGALDDVKAGNFDAAIAKCALEWASLPGSPYGQPTRSRDELAAVFSNSGGVIA